MLGAPPATAFGHATRRRAMDHETPDGTDRRTFLQRAGTLAAASAALGSAQTAAGAQAPAPAAPQTALPRRPLGKTGIDVTILDQGTGKGRDVDRLLRLGFA